MKENLLIKGLIRMFKGFIILLLLLISIIIIYLIPAWLPVKYAKTEKIAIGKVLKLSPPFPPLTAGHATFIAPSAPSN